MFTQINSMHCPFKVMLMSVAGLFAWAAIGFPLNPSFTSEAVKEYKARADESARVRICEIIEGHVRVEMWLREEMRGRQKICYDNACQRQVWASKRKANNHGRESHARKVVCTVW